MRDGKELKLTATLGGRASAVTFTRFSCVVSPGPSPSIWRWTRTLNRNPPCCVQPRLVRIGALVLAAMLLHSAGCAAAAGPGGCDLLAGGGSPRARSGLRTLGRYPEDRQDVGHVRIEWLTFAVGEDPLKLAFRATPPHVILGGSAGALLLLAKMDRLSPIEHAGQALWCEIVRPREDGARSLEPAGGWKTLRRDRASLLWAKSQLSAAGWREGYARLVQSAARRDRVGRSYDEHCAGTALRRRWRREKSGRSV